MIAGKFGGAARFGANATLVAVGRQDAFVTKVDGSGQTLWAKRFGGVDTAADSREAGHALAIDGRGNIFVVGAFADSTKIGETTIVSKGGDDILVMKLSPAGEAIWARGFGSPYSSDIATAVALAPDGNLLISGFAPGAVDFGLGPSSLATGYLVKLAR